MGSKARPEWHPCGAFQSPCSSTKSVSANLRRLDPGRLIAEVNDQAMLRGHSVRTECPRWLPRGSDSSSLKTHPRPPPPPAPRTRARARVHNHTRSPPQAPLAPNGGEGSGVRGQLHQNTTCHPQFLSVSSVSSVVPPNRTPRHSPRSNPAAAKRKRAELGLKP